MSKPTLADKKFFADCPWACDAGVYVFKQDGLIKIGQTSDFRKRFRQFLQNPGSKLELIALIGERDAEQRKTKEDFLLKRYAKHRVSGEYFEDSFELQHDFDRFSGAGKFPPHQVVCPPNDPDSSTLEPLKVLTRQILASGVVPCSYDEEAIEE